MAHAPPRRDGLVVTVQDLLHERHPRIYRDTTYTAIDASPHLIDVQQRRLKRHGHAFRPVVGDARDKHVWKSCRQVRRSCPACPGVSVGRHPELLLQ